MTSPRLGCNKYKIDLNILSKNNIIRQMEDILYCAPCIIPIDTKKQQKKYIVFMKVVKYTHYITLLVKKKHYIVFNTK